MLTGFLPCGSHPVSSSVTSCTCPVSWGSGSRSGLLTRAGLPTGRPHGLGSSPDGSGAGTLRHSEGTVACPHELAEGMHPHNGEEMKHDVPCPEQWLSCWARRPGLQGCAGGGAEGGGACLSLTGTQPWCPL